MHSSCACHYCDAACRPIMTPDFGILLQRDLGRLPGLPLSKGDPQKGGCVGFVRETSTLSDFLEPLIG